MPPNISRIGRGQIFGNHAGLTICRERVVEMAALPFNIALAELSPKDPFVIPRPCRCDHPAVGRLRDLEVAGLLLKPTVPKHSLDVGRVKPSRLRIVIPRRSRIRDRSDRPEI